MVISIWSPVFFKMNWLNPTVIITANLSLNKSVVYQPLVTYNTVCAYTCAIYLEHRKCLFFFLLVKQGIFFSVSIPWSWINFHYSLLLFTSVDENRNVTDCRAFGPQCVPTYLYHHSIPLMDNVTKFQVIYRHSHIHMQEVVILVNAV